VNANDQNDSKADECEDHPSKPSSAAPLRRGWRLLRPHTTDDTVRTMPQ
jgi:hypothetical protein